MKKLFLLMIMGALLITAGCKSNTSSPETPSNISNTSSNTQKTQPLPASGEGDNSDYGLTRPQNLNFIFNNQTLGETTITIKRSQWDKLCDDYRYFYKNENSVKAESYVYKKDGRSWTLTNVGFRLRGNTSRYCPQGIDNGNEQGQMNYDWNPDYYAYANQPNNDYRQTHFKVDFEDFCTDGEEQKMAGCLKGMALKRMDQSCTREIMCYDLFHQNGIWTAPRASHTRLIIKFIEDKTNNTTTTVDFGVYEMFEEVNKQSLKARDDDDNTATNAWKNSKGNLWKCSGSDLTDSSGNGMGVESIRIFYEGETITGNNTLSLSDGKGRIGRVWDQYIMDLKTNKKELSSAKAEFCQFISELNALPSNGSGNNQATIKAFYEKWFDNVDFFIKTYAVNILCGMDDDYWGNANNYYLYFGNNKDGKKKVWFIPFDYDNTLGSSIKDGGFMHDPLDWGRGANRPLLDKLLLVDAYKQKFKDYLLQVSNNEYWNYNRCSAMFKNWGTMVAKYLNSPDLNFTGLGVNSTSYEGWNPGGYSLISKANNIYDATYNAFYKNINGIHLTINQTALETEEQGIKVSITNIPDGAAIRKVYVDGKLVSDLGLIYEDSGTSIDSRINRTDFLYPYVQVDKEYNIKIEYLNSSWSSIETSNEITIKAQSGLGELKTSPENISYTITNGVLDFNEEVKMKAGNTILATEGEWDKYFVIEVQAAPNIYQSWNKLSDSITGFDFNAANVVKDSYKDKDLSFILYYIISNDKYSNYKYIVYNYGATFNL